MYEARQCQLRRTAPATNRLLRLVENDVETGAGELDGGGQAVRAGTNNNRIYIGHVFATFSLCQRSSLDFAQDAPEPVEGSLPFARAD